MTKIALLETFLKSEYDKISTRLDEIRAESVQTWPLTEEYGAIYRKVDLNLGLALIGQALDGLNNVERRHIIIDIAKILHELSSKMPDEN